VYAHVFRFGENGGLVVFNLQDHGIKSDAVPGQLVALEKPYQKWQADLIRGAEMQIIPGKTEDGYLLSYLRPVFDDAGKYQCHVCVAFSMEELHMANVSYLVGTLVVFAIVITLVMIIDVIVVRRDVIRPLRDMARCASNFAYDTEAERFQNVQAMEELNVHTHDEIEELYYEFMSVMKETLYYMANLNRAKNDIQEQEEKLDQISETAYKDALTSVGNPAAFNKLSDVLSKDMEEGKSEFAIVMVDLNNLKYVNDTYGHKLGDGYIRGCCGIICRIYKRSPVFRMGGDEFVVVLRNEDYMSRLLRLTQITEAFMAAHGNQTKEPWERYSASVGMAECEPSDLSVEQVLKRADKAMYENKLKFKEKYGSYR
jgi:diguanylate cyclase (GGDEF)-like protein